ncbi:MAG: molybdenum cofactor biosynthesis protein MoaE [Propionibacteriaceae bacterium]
MGGTQAAPEGTDEVGIVRSSVDPAVVRRAAVVAEPLSIDRLVGLVGDPAVGGIGLFVGVVRGSDHGRGVTSLSYSAHPSAADVLSRCAVEVAGRHEIKTVAVEHRTGRLEIGELAVVVAIGAGHRAAALEACRDLIDTVKLQVPIWKEQRFNDGSVEWVGL